MRMHHVGVSVSDLELAVKWYADVLGMTAAFIADIDGNLIEIMAAVAGKAT